MTEPGSDKGDTKVNYKDSTKNLSNFYHYKSKC